MTSNKVTENRLNLILYTLAAVSIIVLLVLSALWGQEPGRFNVKTESIQYVKHNNSTNLPTGLLYSNTLAHIIKVLLEKPGGYISNDIMPPGVFLDNICNWEHGVVIMVQDGISTLTNNFAKDQLAPLTDKDLTKAEPYFYYVQNTWIFPDQEREFREGLNFLHQYMQRLLNSDPEQKSAKFYPHSENLIVYLEKTINHLAAFSINLKATSSTSLSKPSHPPYTQDQHEITSNQTDYLLIDDDFYQVRGSSWALLHLFQAIKIDFNHVFSEKKAIQALDNMIHELESTQSLKPGLLISNNDSLALASHIDSTHIAAIHLHKLIKN